MGKLPMIAETGHMFIKYGYTCTTGAETQKTSHIDTMEAVELLFATNGSRSNSFTKTWGTGRKESLLTGLITIKGIVRKIADGPTSFSSLKIEGM